MVMHILCSYSFILPQIAYFICLKLLICWHILRLHIICSVLQSLFLEDTTTLATSSSIILATGLTGTVLLLIVIGVSVNKMRQGRKTVDVLEKGEESNSEMISPVTDVNNNRGSPPVLTTEFSIKATEASLEDRQMMARSAVSTLPMHSCDLHRSDEFMA